MAETQCQPAAIATWTFGARVVEAAGKILLEGATALDAVEKGINVAELDTSVSSVGVGGLPNAQGIVELDAAIMDGASRRAGSVAALRNITRPVSVARRVMENTSHVMLVGECALEFAVSEGFVPEETLTDEARRHWRERNRGEREGHDTIGLVALDAGGNLAAGCSTSGLPYKLPGRVGDSPIVGAGLYVDNEIGGASATGSGEEIMKSCASFLVIEFMRNGCRPVEACRRVIDRIVAGTPDAKDVMVGLIALARHGEFGAASTKTGFPYSVWTPEGTSLRESG